MNKLEMLKHILLYYLAIPISFFFRKKCKETWLISERGDEAKDNGYYFYRYLRDSHPEIQVKYVITRASADFNLIHKEDVVPFRSFMHYMYFINSRYLISTHYMGYSPLYWLFASLDKRNLLILRGKKIFLQHGIIYNLLPSLFNSRNNLFITSSEQEKEFIRNNFKLDKNTVKCLGLPRYDYFKNDLKNFILIMPTWRKSLNAMTKEEFVTSDYYRNWNKLLNNDELSRVLQENNLKIFFYPHYEMQKFIDLFEATNENIVFASSNKYKIHDLLDQCKAFITDYSSTFFDIAYNNKPLIYFQFDYEEFYNTHYKEGYLNPEEDGFGVIAHTEDEVIREINNMIKNNFKNEQIYSDRINKFYKFFDQNNCQRIYDEILKL